MGLKIAIFLQALHMLSFVNSILSYALEDGEGVCNRTEIRNKLVIVHQEVKVAAATTEIPCEANSWLDEISCMNKIERGRKIITKTINVSEPVTIKFCCPGYIRISNKCFIPTTVATTIATTVEETTLVTTETTTQPTTVAVTTLVATETTTQPTSLAVTTLVATETTTQPTSLAVTTVKTTETTTQPTTVAVTTRLPDITTKMKADTTEVHISTTRLRGTTRMTTDTTTVKVTDATPTTRDVTTKPATKSQKTTYTRNTKIDATTGSDTTVSKIISISTPKSTMKTTSKTPKMTTTNALEHSNKGTTQISKGEVIATTLLYVSIGCVLVLITFVAAVLLIYYRRKRNRSKSLTMPFDDGIQNPCYQGTHGGVDDILINDYTKMKFNDETHEELKGILDFTKGGDDDNDGACGCAESSGIPGQNTNEYTKF